MKALRQQAEELEAELAEYELVKSGKVEIKVTSLSELGLVKARIKSGMDQAILAKHLNVNASKIMSYESTLYSITAIEEIRKIANMLNVEIPEKVIPSNFNGKISGILGKLTKVGLDQKFVLARLILPQSHDKVAELSGFVLDKYTLGLYKHLNHIFGWTWDDLTNSGNLTIPAVISASVKFKVESTLKPEKINVYLKYAHYLANFAVASAKTLPKKISLLMHLR